MLENDGQFGVFICDKCGPPCVALYGSKQPEILEEDRKVVGSCMDRSSYPDGSATDSKPDRSEFRYVTTISIQSLRIALLAGILQGE